MSDRPDARAASPGLAARLGTLRRRLVRGAWMVRFERVLDASDAAPPAAPAGVAVRRATPADDVLVDALALGREPMARRRARGETAFLAALDGRPVGCTFLARAPVTLDGYLLAHAPRPDEAYHYGLHVLRDARRRGVADALSRAVAAAARADGARVLTCWVDERNRAGVAVQDRVGLRRRERMLLIVVANAVSLIPWRRTLAPEGTR